MFVYALILIDFNSMKVDEFVVVAGRMDLRSSSKFRQTTTGAEVRRRRELGTVPNISRSQQHGIKPFSRQLNHYQTQVSILMHDELYLDLLN